MIEFTKRTLPILACFSFMGCKPTDSQYEAAPISLLKDYPSYALGKSFEVEGKSILFGKYEYTFSLAYGGIASTSRQLYKIGDIFICSTSPIPGDANGVRGTWGPIDSPRDAKAQLPGAPDYALHVEQIKATKPETTSWSSFR